LKVTFPHMGNIYLAVKALFDGLGIDYAIPPFNSRKALEIGSFYSPEEICLPFKIMIGNYIQAIEMGADTVIITGSCGPCRFGEYCEMQMKLLKRLGKPLDFIVIDAPKAIGVNKLLSRLGKIAKSNTKSKAQKLLALSRAIRVMSMIDHLEAMVHEKAGYEKNRGKCKELLHRTRAEALKCNNPAEMLEVLRNAHKSLNKIETDSQKKPVRIAVIGEIYTVIEPFSNLYIEDKLMDYGVSTRRKLTPSWWVGNMVLTPTRLHGLDIRRGSKKYLPYYIGGHARECIGEAVLSADEGMDGAIQIFPMGCMPEIVSKAILPSVARDRDFPIMSLVVDEMTGEAGYVTRIEAFIDMLERRKENALSRS
jgi:predicted nucleotide-binding protein (sugar kinase/HSP70/actin superfamily)